MSAAVLALLETLLSAILNWIFGKTSDKAEQTEYKKELQQEVDNKNEEIKVMSAPDRTDADVLAGLRHRQIPNNKS